VIKSTVGSIRLEGSDPGLTRADATIRALFGRPSTARSPRRIRTTRRPTRR